MEVRLQENNAQFKVTIPVSIVRKLKWKKKMKLWVNLDKKKNIVNIMEND